ARRDGRQVSVPAEHLVPGDLVILQAGDMVPADVRLLHVKTLRVEEAALTGESVPAEKQSEPVAEETALGDRHSMAYGGTLVTQGTGLCVVVATGVETELGRISRLLTQTTQLETPLTRQLETVGRWVTAAVVVLSLILFSYGYFARHSPLTDALLVAIALAVAAVPEGLPAIITISLAVGVRRMAARKAVVRYLPAVETLGSTTVIGSDKTGTLTRNEMTVQALWAGGRPYRLAGVGYEPVGELLEGDQPLTPAPDAVQELLAAAVLCNDAAVHPSGASWAITGDPTEAALVVAGRKIGLDEGELRTGHPRLDAVPFESQTQYMATLHGLPEGGAAVYVKGAPEVVLERCGLEPGEAEGARHELEALGRRGMRVLALAKRPSEEGAVALGPEHVREGLAFLGLVGMIDPPRPEAVEAIRVCQAAGITVKMITGDHPATAAAIGRALGLGADQPARTGSEIGVMSDTELEEAVRVTNVFARVAPEHKLRLVEALQRQGHVVAMTGDGVNDAPALKRADIGVAMGVTGTSVAKEAAKIVLTDDNFATIAASVEEGRRVYDNLIKALAFVLPTNLGLAFTLAAALFFFPAGPEGHLLLPMAPLQILWINLVASVALSLPIAFEVLEPGAMARPPRRRDEPVFGAFVLVRTLLAATVMAVGVCGLFLWEYHRMLPIHGHVRSLAEAQTLSVTTIALFQMFYLQNCRSLRESVFSLGFFSNPSVFAGVGALLGLQVLFTELPFLQKLFGTASLDVEAWRNCALVAASIFPVIALEKWLWRRAAAG
ncbi:MAG: HAD-IC family P-type ATPase, partial [Deltaproteobacteria bacterium]|nr:HAD-IC family P-type ATPase [Deltaproteobacteria bacterium]